MTGWRAMLGLVVPSNNAVVLPEFYSAAPTGVTVYETRMRVEGDLTLEAVRRMVEGALDAGDMLRQTGVDAIGYCCMGSTVVKGWAWEAALLDQLARMAPCGAVSANSALKRALDALGARRVALVTPYPQHLNELLPGCFADRQIEVAAIQGLPTLRVEDVKMLQPEQVYRVARHLRTDGVDAVCLLATDMRTFPVIEALEKDFGLPVLTSNQCLLWALLQDAGIRQPLDGLGALLRQ
jgi:maleate cis-trans isomerase